MTAEKKGVVLLIAPVMDMLLNKLDENFELVKLYEYEKPEVILSQRQDDIKAVVTRGDVGVQTSVLEQLNNVGLIAVFGVGTDAIDLDYTRSRNIAVAITSGVLTQDVADMAMALMLSGARKIVHGHQFVMDGQWANEPPALGTQVSGKRIGIVGMGNIGQAIAQRARAFDMQIHYFSRTAKPELPYKQHNDLTALARESDFLVIAASGGASTQNIINAEVIGALSEQAWIINIARGSLVDEAALIAALKEHRIAGAALDVFNNEPHINDAFRKLDNVILQPHVGSATHETRKKMSETVFANVDAFFMDKPLPNAI